MSKKPSKFNKNWIRTKGKSPLNNPFSFLGSEFTEEENKSSLSLMEVSEAVHFAQSDATLHALKGGLHGTSFCSLVSNLLTLNTGPLSSLDLVNYMSTCI